MQRQIVSPDGKSRWNGHSWEPIQQPYVGGGEFESIRFDSLPKNEPYFEYPEIVQSKSDLTIGKILFWSAISIVAISVLMVVSGVLYVWASSLTVQGGSVTVTKFEVTSPTFFGDATGCSEATILEYGEYYACDVKLNRDADIEIELELKMGENKVDIYTMTEINFEKFKNGDEFLYIEELSATNVNSIKLDDRLVESTYVFVVYNSGG